MLSFIAGQSYLPILTFLVGCGLLTMILLRRWSRYYRKSPGRSKKSSAPIEAVPRPDGPWSGMERDSQARINRQQVELYDMARDINGQINSKIIMLEQLIATSQAQIERMESLMGEAEQKSYADSAE